MNHALYISTDRAMSAFQLDTLSRLTAIGRVCSCHKLFGMLGLYTESAHTLCMTVSTINELVSACVANIGPVVFSDRQAGC